ncbi:MAG: hypothetical protein LV480_01135 [Methylacidiphilales bacterium]|nr:hypothetical protein [Candidatus Methylacidiphilales bacterium]
MKGLFHPVKWSCALLLAFSLVGASAQIAPELREEGVLYFDGNLPDKITTTLRATTTVYLHRDFQMALASLYPGQKIELIGMAPEGYLLKANYRNNTVTGWIRPADLPTGIDPSVFVVAKKNQEHRDAVAVAIANKDVIRGMTPDEVRQSVGRPEQVSSRIDPNGSALIWTYTTYRQEPQYQYTFDAFGRPYLQTYYVKIPIGQLIVAFANGVVVSVEQHKTDPNSPGVVTN